MAADDFDLDAILNRVAADTLRELEATTDLEAGLAAVISGNVPGADEPPTDNPELAVLEAACFDIYFDRADEQVNFDVVAAVKAAVRDGFIRSDFDHSEFGWRLTEAGEKRLAELWGPDRVPPGKGGHVSCWDHGVYVAAPGDLWACPECPVTDDEVLRQVEADADPLINSVLAELRANDIRRLQNGQLTADETAVLTAMADCAVVSRGGRWVTSVNYTAELLRDAGLAEVQEDPDGCRYLTPTADGDVWLVDAAAQDAAESNIRAFEASRRRRKKLRRLAFVAALVVVAVLAFVAIGRL